MKTTFINKYKALEHFFLKLNFSIKASVFLVLFLISSNCFAQNTISKDEKTTITIASLKDCSWLKGNWSGTALGGICQETWSEPLGNTMMFNFKLVKNDAVVFYELGHISEKNGTLFLEFRHFDMQLNIWNQVPELIQLPLLKMSATHLYFENYTFEKKTANEIVIFVKFDDEEMIFNYSK